MREFFCHNVCIHAVNTCSECRSATREEALRQAPGKPIVLLNPAQVKVRSICAAAVAYTVTDVLIEWDEDTGYHLRWEASWLVRRAQVSPRPAPPALSIPAALS